MNKLHYHGGNINAARALYPNAPRPWIDLSTGINPVPYPVGDIPEAAWTRLPELDALAELEASARDAYNVDPSADVVATPGTQALIQLLPRILGAKDIGILNFTYTEHERSWRAAGARVTVVDKISELARFQVGVVVNPNNPDGTLHSLPQMTEIAVALNKRNSVLIVDEAFMDGLDDGFSLAPAVSQPGAIVLRSFGKTYGLAGIRLGFALTNPGIARQLREALGPWAVSGPAIEVARHALRDNVWLRTSIARLRVEADRLDTMLKAAGFNILGGSALFRLASSSNAQNWFRLLCNNGILTRPFETRPDWLRFGIPHHEKQWQRLQMCLESYIESNPAAARHVDQSKF